ncbi:hypothetical protein [Streptomyces sp. NBC_00105]|uniref:hypothetical protein n=1 Tax=Streptomyces sp. NBC_00105 TaxID=2903622 RepID=UPI003249B0DA
MDIESLWGLRIDQNAKQDALRWLADVQQHDGTWWDWHGIEHSPEATAYAIYVLQRGEAEDLACVDDALEALLALQRVDGMWGMGPDEESPNNWVTFTALMAIQQSIGTPASTSPGSAVPSPMAFSGPKASRPPIGVYDMAIPTPLDTVPHTRPMDHTMYSALDSYVSRKIPRHVIEEALASETRLEVHGVYPPHFRQLASQLGYENVERIRFGRGRRGKHFNFVRPWFYRAVRPDGDRVVVVAVIPGSDYVQHYASMVRHIALMASTQGEDLLGIFRYPYAESQIADWTALDDGLIGQGDRVLLGQVEDIRSRLERSLIPTPWLETDYYGASRFSLPDGSRLTLLGVKFSFWGSISHILCHRICNLGAREVLYVAKLGALTSPGDLYSQVFCPSRFWLLQHDNLVYEVPTVPNYVLSKLPFLDTGGHVSVPTVLEEDYHQRKLAAELGAHSIDNEISQMAWAISLANVSTASTAGFSAVHFATDYIRQAGERRLPTEFHLANNRGKAAVDAKSSIMEEIVNRVLIPYLGIDG